MKLKKKRQENVFSIKNNRPIRCEKIFYYTVQNYIR